MDYYSVFKKKEILPFVTTWMRLKDIMLTERNQAQKDKNFLYGILIGGTGGVILISVVMGLLGGIK